MHRIFVWVLLLAAGKLCAQTTDQLKAPNKSPQPSIFAADVSPQQLQAAYFHGTIDVVVSTREGFVLATDSRATSGNSHSDDAQKAFAVGPRAGCVIAGLIGAEMRMEGFELREAMGTYLTQLNDAASKDNRPVTATEIAQRFSGGLDDVAGLLLPGVAQRPSIVGAASAVSLSPDGKPEWVSLYLPVDVRVSQQTNQYYYSTGTPIYLVRPLSLGLRFDVQPLGFPYIAEQLLDANTPAADPFSGAPIMQKFYERKRSGHLDEFTLAEALDLAKLLVSATIALAPIDAGVGGEIDILTVTNSGVHWIQRKQNIAPFPPPYHLRFAFNSFEGGIQPLDGLQCVRCIFKDSQLTYSGKGNVELLAPTFEGNCQLTLQQGARQRNPTAVDRLEHLVGGKCKIGESH